MWREKKRDEEGLERSEVATNHAAGGGHHCNWHQLLGKSMESGTQKSVNNPSKVGGLGTREANFTPEVA